MTTRRKLFSTYAVQRRATRRSQDADDDAFYAEQARKRREAEGETSALGMAACTIPPAGWSCTRAAGHQGPCAAVPTAHQAAPEGNAS